MTFSLETFYLSCGLVSVLFCPNSLVRYILHVAPLATERGFVPFGSFQSGAKAQIVMGVGSAASLAEAINLRDSSLSTCPFVGALFNTWCVMSFGTMASFRL